MKYKKMPIVVGAVAVTALGFLIANQLWKSGDQDGADGKATTGMVNPDSPSPGLATEAMPQLTNEKFELPPSLGTGSYTEPAAKKDTKKQGDDTQ
jgi:hypothetical protein